MKTKSLTSIGLKGLFVVGMVTAIGISAASATLIYIDINEGNDNSGVDNVLFNNGVLVHSGTLVQGDFNGSGSGYIVDFTSSSGNGMIHDGGGQAKIEGLAGNDPFSSLTFGLEDGATFTKAVFNADAFNEGHIDGYIDFVVTYLNGAGSPFTESLTLEWNGQNYYTINALGGAAITEVTFSSTTNTFQDANQFRLGGFASGNVPDGGTTIVSLGMALLGLGSMRRFLTSKL